MSISPKIKQILREHPAFTQASALAELCKPLYDLGIVYFSHAHVDAKKHVAGLGLCPEFIESYFKNGFYQFDLHMAPKKSQQEFVIWDLFERKNQSRYMHEEFMRCGQAHTFSIIQHNGDTKDYYHFGARVGDVGMNAKYLQIVDKLQQFILFFHDKVQHHASLRQAYGMRIAINSTKGGFLTSTDQLSVPTYSIETPSEIHRYYLDGGKSYLTLREYQCLSLLSEGKKNNAIAEQLSITPRTVKEHIANVKNKLQCDTLFQLGLMYSKLKSD